MACDADIAQLEVPNKDPVNDPVKEDAVTGPINKEEPVTKNEPVK
jgi:hypothetical protein